MKFLAQLVFIFFAGYLLELFLPWWGVAIAAIIFGYLLNTKLSFLAGFLGIGMLWLLKAYLISANAAVPLVDKVAAVFTVNRYILFTATVLLGGLVSGFAALTGSLLKKKRRNPYY